MSALDERLLEHALAEIFRGPAADLSPRVLAAWERERSGAPLRASDSLRRRRRLRIGSVSAVAASLLAALIVWRLLAPGETVATAAGEAAVFRAGETEARLAREIRAGDLVAAYPSAAAPAIAWGGDTIRCETATLVRFDGPGAARLRILTGGVRVEHAGPTVRSVATAHAVARLRDDAVAEIRVLPPFEGDDDMFTQAIRNRIRGSLAAGAVTTIAVLQGSVVVDARGASRTVEAGETVAVGALEIQGAAAAPGPEHELLKRLAGSWTTRTRFRAAPGAEWQEMGGTEERSVGCGGRWLFSTTRSEYGFEGRQQLGYDPRRKKFVATWVDSESPTMSAWEGTYDEKSKVLTMVSEVLEPETAKPTKMRMTYDLAQVDSMLFRLFRGAGADEIQILEIAYARNAEQR